MPDKVLIALSCGTDNPNRTTRGLHFTKVAHEQGKDVTLFLLDEGVYIAKKGVADKLVAATGDAAIDHLTYLTEFEVPIIACTPCAVSRGISEDDLLPSSRMGTAVEFFKLVEGATVISF